MIREYLAPPRPLPPDQDESVASFVSRHFTSEVVERVADPLLAGIYGGTASALSVRATLPQMVDSECRHGSLVRGALAVRNTPKSGVPPQPLFTAMHDGMQRMIDAIVHRKEMKTLIANSLRFFMNAV